MRLGPSGQQAYCATTLLRCGSSSKRVHPAYQKPELLATAPNQLWSWDITKLRGPAKWSYFYLYVILDVFSRYVVGWMVAMREGAGLASKLIEETCEKQNIQPGQLGLHADRGSAMRSKPVAFLLADLSVTKTHTRPYTSNDNPYSESQFRTMKYRPEFPDRFGCIQDSRAFCQPFFAWYNDDHRHSGIGMMTPPWSTPARRRSSGNSARPSSTLPIWPTRIASSAVRRHRSILPRRSGSINPKAQTIKLTKLHSGVSQSP
jgi:transposase InsO family protein